MTYDEVFRCAIVQLNICMDSRLDVTEQARHLRLREDLGMDSLDIVELMLNVEDNTVVMLKDPIAEHGDYLEPGFTLDEFVRLYVE
jgi:acyl carrier protein